MKRDQRAEDLVDLLERLAQSQANVDPLLITCARETAAELLATYLEHCRYNKAARMAIARARTSAN